MNIYTVSFFGHREIKQPFLVEKRVEKIIVEIINSKEYVEFLIGRDGEFDQIVSSVIRRTTRKYNYGNSALIIVLPYMKAEFQNNEQSFLTYYDEVEICPESSEAHFKAAIQIRNRNMVDRSDLIVCCIEHNSGGAFKTIQYATRLKKNMLNIADNI